MGQHSDLFRVQQHRYSSGSLGAKRAMWYLHMFHSRIWLGLDWHVLLPWPWMCLFISLHYNRFPWILYDTAKNQSIEIWAFTKENRTLGQEPKIQPHVTPIRNPFHSFLFCLPKPLHFYFCADAAVNPRNSSVHVPLVYPEVFKKSLDGRVW